MSPAEHYAKAEEILAQYDEAEKAGRVLLEAMTENFAHAKQMRFTSDQLLTGLGQMLARAQVHATLATARHDAAPVIVAAPAELIDRVKTVDPTDFSRGILFIPDEMSVPDERPIDEVLVEAMTKPVGEA